ncbi:alpha-ketoacid dehydrogenase subunit beta [Bradyrhizobium yuanmingense]|uniref:alpha-ketoacid dehydrogenase subunit beta n=1 Tax=Bradyrhizobium yuanmingense TaxID=108015 RepID=UPI0023BA3A4D|nr:alpha-ketoacid dehydrogenase subunit beta [Bradyrhizobium yuanmingense]MDF0498618.1 alpha-ketoacid dehydrogenase subunit beta [Bradyrhizobium yuanmingense]
MSKKTYMQAINEAIRQEMERDSTVILIGEDLAGGHGGTGEVGGVGGPFGQLRGIYKQFGPNRMIDTPISESAIMGVAAGAALTGLRPVAELMFVDFVGVCFDQIYNQIAKFRYMFGGHARTPLVIRATVGAGMRAAAQHSQTLHPLFTMVPGLKVVMPSNPYDAKGLLIQAIRDNDPVIYLESKSLFGMEGEVPDEPYRIPFGEANILREGKDLTIVALGAMVTQAEKAVANLARGGLSVEVLDPRTTSPLDEDSILESVEKTGRLVVVDESPPRCSLAADIAGLVADKGFKSLKGPIKQVTCPHTPVPFAPTLEDAYLPSPARIERAARSLFDRAREQA